MSHHSHFSDPPGAKAAAFVEALGALCRQHGVQLTTSDYDGLQVWDLNPTDKWPIYCAGIEDKTADGAATAADNRARWEAERKAETIARLEAELARLTAIEWRDSTIPARPARTEEQVTGWACELCKTVTDDERCWKKEGARWDTSRVRRVEIELEEGSYYPEGGTGEKTIVDMCPTCFKTKLLPWIESQGGKARTEEVDY